ncbi:hypothetical protein H5U35_05290 [Candidatus Aerophobetes bacterium]|nr:hypothetical protein [Candidatus Aerophobetes bacterium]
MPFYLPMILHADLKFIRAVRVFRIFKWRRDSEPMRIFENIFKAKKRKLFVSL